MKLPNEVDGNDDENEKINKNTRARKQVTVNLAARVKISFSKGIIITPAYIPIAIIIFRPCLKVKVVSVGARHKNAQTDKIEMKQE